MELNGEELSMPMVDFQAASYSFECAPHAFFVAMPPIDPTRGAIDLTDKRAGIKRRSYLACGVVICCGSETGLTPGDWALVEPKYAKRVDGLNSGRFKYRGEVWMFGITSPSVRTSIIVQARHTVLGILGSSAFETLLTCFPDPKPLEEQPTARTIDTIIRKKGKRGGRYSCEGRVLLNLHCKEDRRGELYIPEVATDRPDVGQVLSASPACNLVKPGDWVIYQRRGLDGLYADGNKNHAYLPERAIFARCLEVRE